jgi:hypothetical protein
MDDKYLGRIVECESFFTSPRKFEEHYFHKFKGYGWNKELIQELVKRNIIQLRIVEDEGKRILITDPRSVMINGKNWTNTLDNGEKEEQWILSEKQFNKIYEAKHEMHDRELSEYST